MVDRKGDCRDYENISCQKQVVVVVVVDKTMFFMF